MNPMKKILLALVFAAAMASPAMATAPASEKYEEARVALDRGNYSEARELFRAITAAGGPRTEEALYWKAYSEVKLGNERAATRTIAELERLFPEGRWVDDARALEVELAGVGGHRKLPEDEELKLYALQGLVMSNPERAVPIIKGYLEEGKSEQLKERAMFLLMQADTDEARDAIETAALNPSSQMLRITAIRTLGMIGDDEAMALLERAFRESDDGYVQAMIVNAFMTAGEAGRIKQVLDKAQNDTVRAQAIQMLGVMGETEYLKGLYPGVDDPHVKRIIVQSVAMGGDAEFLVKIIREEEETDLRIMAIQSLMMTDAEGIAGDLRDLYAETDSRHEKHAIVQALAMQGEGEILKQLFRNETDKGLRRQIMQSMAMFLDEDEAGDFFLEILEN